MREWIDLMESAGRSTRYPSVIDVDSLAHFLFDLHHSQEDFSEGDLLKRLYRFSQYELRELPLASLNLDEWYHDEDAAAEYSQRPIGDDYPPIVFDAVKKSIIDGTHRANAAARAGENTIPAYVGVKTARNTGPERKPEAVVYRSSHHTPNGWMSRNMLNGTPEWKKDW